MASYIISEENRNYILKVLAEEEPIRVYNMILFAPRAEEKVPIEEESK